MIEPEDRCELGLLPDDGEFRAYIAKSPTGLLLVAEVEQESGLRVTKSDAGDFRKWLRSNAPDLNVELQDRDGLLQLRSADLWLPLVFLATDVTLPLYLNLVANYIHDKMRGALAGEHARVHLDAVYEETPSKLVKRFRFDGDLESLKAVIKKLDLNEFFDPDSSKD